MGWLTRWKRSAQANELERTANALERLEKLERTAGEHTRVLEKLELDRPGFIAALEEMAERCHDILDQAEHKRGRIAAAESRQRRKEEARPELDFTAPDRETRVAATRALLRSQGKIH